MNTKPVVLIAEDEEDLREMYTMALSSEGFEVLQAINGKDVLQWLENKASKIDIILLDIVMPEMDGFETLEKIKKDEWYKKIPVLISTNLDNDDDQKEAIDLGADGYFIKSKHTPSELVKKIKEVLER